MDGAMSVQVLPATAARWDDLVTVFGRRGNDPSWCWCRLFLQSEVDRRASGRTPNNREALRHEVTRATTPPGLIAYADGHPAGWTRIGLRSAFPGVGNNKALARLLTDDPGAWWVTCFAVDAHHRRSGVASALLRAAVTFAGEHGATVVQGHPVDVDRLTARRVSGSALYTGTMALFRSAGFSEIGRTFPSRPVMQRSMH